MSLTRSDLQAIAELFERKFDEKFDEKFDQKFDQVIKPELSTLNYKIDHLYEELTTRADKHDADIAELQTTVNRIENTQQAEIGRADRHDRQIARLNRELGLL